VFAPEVLARKSPDRDSLAVGGASPDLERYDWLNARAALQHATREADFKARIFRQLNQSRIASLRLRALASALLSGPLERLSRPPVGLVHSSRVVSFTQRAESSTRAILVFFGKG
jgi:hypothetical protein